LAQGSRAVPASTLSDFLFVFSSALMAQTMATGMVSTPFSLPPGLDATNGTGGASAAATGAPASSGLGAVSATPQAAKAASKDFMACKTEDRQAILSEVRASILEEVDAKVAEKMKDLWTRGNKMIKKVEEDSQLKNTTILAELEKCREKQDSLKTEHEQLATLLQSMVQHINIMNSCFGGMAGPKIASPTPCSLACLSAATGTNGTASATTQPNSSSASAASTMQESPLQDFGSDLSGVGFAGSFAPLAPVPDFPFPATPAAPTPTPSAATPLSLAEALGSEAPSTSVPVSLIGSLPPPCQGQRMFSFTLRKADGTDLGLNVSHHEDDKALRVEGVRPDGAVEAWNRQCVGSTASEKAVLPGDRIVSVNGVVNNPAKMLEECRDRQLLKITVLRGEAASIHKTPSLRADAPEFVPPGSSASGAPLAAITETPEQEETARRVWKDDTDKTSSTEKPTEL
jgi:hypothetical protein